MILVSSTHPRWFAAASRDLHALLSDHLHCERKAAENALSLVRRYPHRGQSVDVLGRLAHEETSHVIQVAALMGTCGYTAPEFQANTDRALEICERTAESAQIYPVLWGQVARSFSSGDVTSAGVLAKRFLENGYVKGPGMFQICLGISWGQPATPEAMTYMRNLLPPGSPWFAFGISLYQFPMVAQAVLLGGHVRVGLEDNLYLEKGKLAPSNAALVEKAAHVIEVLGDQVASPAEAREILGLPRALN